MNKAKKKLIIVLIASMCIIFAIVMLIVFGGRKKEDKVKIGFIMSGSIQENGWNGMHYEGIKKACEKYKVELAVKENVKEFTGECEKAIEELAEEGAGMIILSSYGYSEEAKDLVKKYPNITFNGNSSEYHDKNMTSYFVRMYQARYLSGIVAGLKTKSNRIGYVAAMANNEVNRGINAFTMGVKSVNPDATVVVHWTGEWDCPEKEKKAVEELVSQENADVLTYHQNQPNVVEKAEELGVYSIGYHIMLENKSEKYLTSVVCNWQYIYEELIRTFLVGKANTEENYWIGMEANATDLPRFSSEVTEAIRTKVEQAKEEILAGKEIFSGEIYDTEGNLRCKEKEALSDEMMLENFDWFVKGVEFYGK